MTGDRFFDSIRGFGIIRPSDAPLAGVSKALATRWNVDPLLVRAGFVVLSFFGGAGITLYVLGWMLLPDHDGRIHAQEPFYGKLSASVVIGGILLLMSVTTPNIMNDNWSFFGPLGLIITIVLIVTLIVSMRDTKDFPEQPGFATTTQPTAGGAGAAQTPSGENTVSYGASASNTNETSIPGFSTLGSSAPYGSGGAFQPTAGEPSATASDSDPMNRYKGGDDPAYQPGFFSYAGTNSYSSNGTNLGSEETMNQNPTGAPSPAQTQPLDRSNLYADVADYGGSKRPAASGRVVLLGLAFILLVGALLTFAIDRGLSPLSNPNLVLATFAVVSLILGLAVIGYGIAGRRGGGLTALSIITALLTIPVGVIATLPHNEHHVLMGEGSWAPTSQADVDGGFSFVMGTMDIDVTDLDEGEFEVIGRMGELNITVHDDQKIAIITDFTMAEVPSGGDGNMSNNSFSGELTYYVGDIDSIDDADIVIHTNIMMSSLKIERAS